MNPPTRLFIESIAARFADQKKTAEKALAQVSDAQLHHALDQNTNSLAVIVKHMGGNLRSRFTDFLTADGEKPDRDRDLEFVEDTASRPEIMAHWDRGWACLFDAISGLTDSHLQRQVYIRGQAHTVADALLRSLGHAGYHVGQIVQLARFLAKDQWQTLTIPRGKSKEFNAAMEKQFPKT
jgi:hypothetical protein